VEKSLGKIGLLHGTNSKKLPKQENYGHSTEALIIIILCTQVGLQLPTLRIFFLFFQLLLYIILLPRLCFVCLKDGLDKPQWRPFVDRDWRFGHYQMDGLQDPLSRVARTLLIWPLIMKKRIRKVKIKHTDDAGLVLHPALASPFD